ncbi:non-lysosomal glucosylceramidase [Biomphalaria pfeifferi]|uniref:Non-lysosomal glucosylceramidase n=1 Tax=Biomphalaria pfeifferi TaxID=112525 RepID=A0AAD8BP54_BIOPF|nr:non-lysosomal glucosylceramidase [Biomphalaria pfeifferi]
MDSGDAQETTPNLSDYTSLTEPLKTIPGLPDYGWRVPLSYECNIKCKPFSKPRLNLIPQYVSLGVRYFGFWLNKKRQGRRPFIDHLNQTRHMPIYGCPIGGIGSGSIGRGYRGEFCRFQMVPGIYHYSTVDADQFIVCIRKNSETKYIKVLSCAGKRKKNRLKAWDWSFPPENGVYHALYPRAWSIFNIPELMVTLKCRQVSPVIPHDYVETTLPTAAFIWEIENNSSEDLDVSITFTFKNGQGTKEDRDGGVWSEGFRCDCDGDNEAKGVLIYQHFNGLKCSYGIAAKATEKVSVSVKNRFNPQQDGSDLWIPLKNNGHLDYDFISAPTPPTSKGEELASAVCANLQVMKNSRSHCEFSLCWDMPKVQFASKENVYTKRYCQKFSNQGSAAEICSYALKNYPKWEAKIEKWQKPILESNLLPTWYKSAIFNELYFISDGGTVWFDVTDSQHETVNKYGRFAYLEGQEYRMFNTYDVHHYSSFALLMLWPKLQLSLQYDFGDTITAEDSQVVTFLMSGERGTRKVANCVPHDIGDPEDEPWKRVNAYNIHPTHDWKDLNLKFVLQVYRDYSALEDKKYLETMYPKCKVLMETSRKWDVDGDGIIDNSGYADQTFDAWKMKGASAYCGGLWLAALRMMVSMAEELDKQEDKADYQALLSRGAESFHKKLWNGSYYNFDCSRSIYHDSIMADQLAGYWFLKASNLPDEKIFPSENVKTTLLTIFDKNVMGFQKGYMGAINSTRPNGKMDPSSPQTEEFWVGITYALAATMIQEGLIEEGFHTASGAYHICWNVLGLHFQTPEAYTINQGYRSLAYMRPLAIWAIQWALEKFHPNMLASNKVETDDTFQSSMCDTLVSSMYDSRIENEETFPSFLSESKIDVEKDKELTEQKIWQ